MCEYTERRFVQPGKDWGGKLAISSQKTKQMENKRIIQINYVFQ